MPDTDHSHADPADLQRKFQITVIRLEIRQVMPRIIIQSESIRRTKTTPERMLVCIRLDECAAQLPDIVRSVLGPLKGTAKPVKRIITVNRQIQNNKQNAKHTETKDPGGTLVCLQKKIHRKSP